ncbi:MAG: hypothetical protein ACI81V_000677 [Lentimonas sp.]|jgi:hypothetical protein
MELQIADSPVLDLGLIYTPPSPYSQPMKPRHLRHRLEKAAKLLVLVQKHVPEVDCRVDEDRGEYGQLVADFTNSDIDPRKMMALGQDLESKGYQFTLKKSPWLGQISYRGVAPEKTTIVLSQPINKDRLAINEDSPEKAYSFKNQ